MSTLGALPALAIAQYQPTLAPFDYGRALTQATNIQGGQLANQTSLLQLEELRRQQETAALVRQHYQQNPGAVLGGGGPQSLLGSPGGAAPGAGPLTQQAFGPGGALPAQTVPAAPDLSQFATGQPPQSTLGAPGPRPQPHPLEALMRQNPDAAMQILGQQQKGQETRLSYRTKILDYMASAVQGATDQASWDQARQEVARVDPQAAAQLPPAYARETRDRVVAQALSAKDRLTLQVQDMQAQADVIKARLSGRSTDVDNQLRGMGVTPGQETPAQMREALQAVEEGKVRVSAAHGQGQIKETPFGAVRVGKSGETEFIQAPGGGPLYGKPTEAEQRAASFSARAKAAHDNAVALEEKGLTPGIWSKVGEALPFGLGNYLVGEDQQRYRQAVSQFAQALLRKESGAAISPTEYTMTETTYFPQPGNSKKVIEDKRRERERIIQEMQEEGKGTGRTGGQGQPTPSGGQTSQAPAGSKVVTRAALHAEAQRRGVAPEQAEQMARQKGYTVR